MAEKKYKLNFQMTDGTKQSVEFAVPGGEGSSLYPCTDGTYFWRELPENDPVTGSNRVYLHPPKMPIYNKTIKHPGNIFRTDETIYSTTKKMVCPVYYATIVCSAWDLGDPDSEGLYHGNLFGNQLAIASLEAYAEGPGGEMLTLPFIDGDTCYLGSVYEYDGAYLYMSLAEDEDYYHESDVVITLRLIKL